MENAVPGLDAACAQERRERNQAYLDIPSTVCGVSVRQMTPMDLIKLTYAGSPYLVGSGNISYPVAAQFIFHLSVSALTIEESLSAVSNLTLQECDEQISEYVDLTFRDQSSSGGIAPSAPIACLAAWLEYRMGAEPWKWDREKTLSTPIRIIFQQIRCWLSEKGENVANKLSGACTGAFLDNLNSQLQSGEVTKDDVSKINEIWLRGQFGDEAVDAMKAREKVEKQSDCEPPKAGIYSTLPEGYTLP